MFRGIVRSVQLGSPYPVWTRLIRFNSNLNQLKSQGQEGAALALSGSHSYVEGLLSETVKFKQEENAQQSGMTIVDSPREMAARINVQLPMAGRVAIVKRGNIGEAIGKINRTIGENKVRYLNKQQSRFTRPAKLAKQKKREWWRKRFSEGFKDLMDQVRDAKRRGY
ncbi:ribosomal protein S21/MRP21 [Kocuria palustris]|nr:ribosomal protein S21/MRP21 [Kocuria palustris]